MVTGREQGHERAYAHPGHGFSDGARQGAVSQAHGRAPPPQVAEALAKTTLFAEATLGRARCDACVARIDPRGATPLVSGRLPAHRPDPAFPTSGEARIHKAFLQQLCTLVNPT